MEAPVAFRRLLIEAIPRLRRYARSLAHNDAASDDLVQQTLERALLHWRQFDPRRDLALWLLAIAHNAFLDGLRREGRAVGGDASGERGAGDALAGESPDLGLRLDLQAALDSLSPAMREPLLLVCLEQLSYAQVAEVLDLPIGTVMSRVHRARVQLREFLALPQPHRRAAPPSLRRVI